MVATHGSTVLPVILVMHCCHMKLIVRDSSRVISRLFKNLDLFLSIQWGKLSGMCWNASTTYILLRRSPAISVSGVHHFG